MNTMQIKIGDDQINCHNPRLLVALLKRAQNVAKLNFRSTEAELMWMFAQVDRVVELEDKLKDMILSSSKKKVKRKAATKKGLPSKVSPAEEKVSVAANPHPEAVDEDDDIQYDKLGRRIGVRKVTRSDYGKKRKGKALENIRAAAKRRQAAHRIKSRLKEAKNVAA